jgi:hypothetical protein
VELQVSKLLFLLPQSLNNDKTLFIDNFYDYITNFYFSLCTIVAVFNWPIDKHCHIDMSEVLINITTPLRFDTLYDEVLPPEDYTLATAVCPERTSCFSYVFLSSIVHESSHLQCSSF